MEEDKMNKTGNLKKPLTVKPSPCASCPYRRSVPSGVWAASEYDTLPGFDGETADQATSPNGTRLFMCHQADARLCSGWVGHREHPSALLAILLGVIRGEVDPSALDYKTDVPLFASGAEAAQHGKRDIEDPGTEAMEQVSKITTVREMRGEPVSLEEQAAQEGYVPEYEPGEDPGDDFPLEEDYDQYDMADPYDIEYDVP